MGLTALYAAFAAVALWLAGELLLQRRAPLHWRALALVGFLALVGGVAEGSLPLIGGGVLGFGLGQFLASRVVKAGGGPYWVLVPPEQVPVVGRIFGAGASSAAAKRPEPIVVGEVGPAEPVVPTSPESLGEHGGDVLGSAEESVYYGYEEQEQQQAAYYAYAAEQQVPYAEYAQYAEYSGYPGADGSGEPGYAPGVAHVPQQQVYADPAYADPSYVAYGQQAQHVQQAQFDAYGQPLSYGSYEQQQYGAYPQAQPGAEYPAYPGYSENPGYQEYPAPAPQPGAEYTPDHSAGYGYPQQTVYPYPYPEDQLHQG